MNGLVGAVVASLLGSSTARGDGRSWNATYLTNRIAKRARNGRERWKRQVQAGMRQVRHRRRRAA